MGCESCTNGSGGQPAGCRNNGTCSSGGCSKLAVYDWLSNMEMPGHMAPFEYVEVRFKGTRKEFYRNSEKLSLNTGDAVILEATTGHDVGIVSITGELARLQMEKHNALKNTRDIRRVLRKASSDELALWREARGLEDPTMFKARELAGMLSLDMKISDVEYRGDKSKATFYYTAEGRVDFRELIRKLAETFRVRIEMRQIGARQEAARLGGIGSCGRELCCSTWLTDFRSVSTSAARYQQLALNTQKLAGQCGKLKCCLNYELDSYLDALKHFPKNPNKLKTKKGTAFHLKTDIFKALMWFIYADEASGTPIPIPVDRVKEILDMNAEGKYPEDLKDFAEIPEPVQEAFSNVVGQDSLTRFDKQKGRSGRSGKRKKSRKKGRGGPRADAGGNAPKQAGGRDKGGNKPENKQGGGPSNKKKRSNRPKRRRPDNNNGKTSGKSDS
ncbi:MAG: stage 0 sporulation family protein [Cryomorphaceae bacterium]|nr:hypothetical protein [Flavobacteriales bacterium]